MVPKTSTEKDERPDAIASLQSAGFGNAMAMSTAWVEAVSEMSGEVLGFVADRIREDVKTQQKMLSCKDLSELQEVQAEFFQKAIDQYQAETGKLVKMGAAAFGKGAKEKESGNS